MAHDDRGAGEEGEGLLQRAEGGQVEVVGGLIEHEDTLPPWRRSLASRTRARSPPERVLTGESLRRASNPNLSRKLSTRTVRSPTATTPCRPATFSATVAWGSSSRALLVDAHERDRLADLSAPLVRGLLAQEEPQEGRLPRAVGADHPQAHPGPEFEVEGERMVRSP